MGRPSGKVMEHNMNIPRQQDVPARTKPAARRGYGRAGSAHGEQRAVEAQLHGGGLRAVRQGADAAVEVGGELGRADQPVVVQVGAAERLQEASVKAPFCQRGSSREACEAEEEVSTLMLAAASAVLSTAEGTSFARPSSEAAPE